MFLAGELGHEVLIAPLKSRWRRMRASGEPLTGGMLFATVTCAAERDEAFADEVIAVWAALPDKDPEKPHSNPRTDLAAYGLGGGLRRHEDDRVISYLLRVREDSPALKDTIVWILRTVDHPLAVRSVAEAVAEIDHRCEESGGFNIWGAHFADHWGRMRERGHRRMDATSRAVLKAIWDDQGNKSFLRKRAFDLWSATLIANDIADLGAAPPAGLEDRSLAARLRHGDKSAKPELASRIEAEGNRIDRATGAPAAQPSLLVSLIYDDAGERMSPSHANKKGTRYRYYVSQSLIKTPRHNAARGRRVPAGDLECLVEDRLRQFLTCESDLFAAFEPQAHVANECADLIARAAALAERWPTIEPFRKRSILISLVERIDLMRETLEIRILPGRLLSILRDGNDYRDQIRPNAENEPVITLSIPARLKRTGMETRLLIDGATGGARRTPDHSLCRVLAQAHKYNAMVMRNAGKTIAELAKEAGVGGSYFTRILRLSFLAPEVVKAIVRFRHPIELNAKRLVNETRIPISWEQQRALIAAD